MAVPLFTTELFCTVTEPVDAGTTIPNWKFKIVLPE